MLQIIKCHKSWYVTKWKIYKMEISQNIRIRTILLQLQHVVSAPVKVQSEEWSQEKITLWKSFSHNFRV